MLHDLLIALAFVAMVAFPAFVAAMPGNETADEDEALPDSPGVVVLLPPRNARPRQRSLALSVAKPAARS